MKPDTMETTDQLETVIQVRAELERRGITQGVAAKEMGLSPTTLTQLMNGSYGADPAKQLEKLERWLAVQREAKEQARQLPAVANWVETATGEKVLATLGHAQLMGDMVLIYGGAGVGKSSGGREYARRFSNVWLATMNPATSGVIPSLEEIYIALGMKPLGYGGAARMHREIVRKVQDTQGLLIIDEAQHLDNKALDSIRAIHDITGIGIALMGNEAVYSNLTGGNRAAYLDRLFSRIGKRLRLQRAKPDDITSLAGLFGITDAKSLKRLQELGAKPGALRTLVKIIRLATMMAQGETPTLSHLEAAAGDLGV